MNQSDVLTSKTLILNFACPFLVDSLTATRLTAPDLPPDWLQQFETFPDAHQAVIRHLDAYVPGLYFDHDDSRLWAPLGHDDILQHVTRVDRVRLGTIDRGQSGQRLLYGRRHGARTPGRCSGARAACRCGATCSAVMVHAGTAPR